MFAFQVDDMSCAHCVTAITQAVTTTDPEAMIRVDLDTHRVNVESAVATPDAVAEAIREAGYTPVAVVG